MCCNCSCSFLILCLKHRLFQQLRRLQLDEEVEKRRVLEDALHVLATEHHALECSIGVHEVSGAVILKFRRGS